VGGNGGVGGRRPAPNFYALNAEFIGEITAEDNGDHAPTEAALAEYVSACRNLGMAAARWAALNGAGLAALNSALSAKGWQPVAAATGVKPPGCGENAAR
jgi:hypothetical protein